MTNSPLKPTPGPWTPETFIEILASVGDERDYGSMILGGDGESIVAQCVMQRDMDLIADAGTVHHQTGLSPSQMLDMLREVAAVLNALIAQCARCESVLDEELHHVDHCGESLPLTDARAILAKMPKEMR